MRGLITTASHNINENPFHPSVDAIAKGSVIVLLSVPLSVNIWKIFINRQYPDALIFGVDFIIFSFWGIVVWASVYRIEGLWSQKASGRLHKQGVSRLRRFRKYLHVGTVALISLDTVLLFRVKDELENINRRFNPTEEEDQGSMFNLIMACFIVAFYTLMASYSWVDPCYPCREST